MNQKKSQKKIPLSLPEEKASLLLIVWIVVMYLGLLCLALLLTWLNIPDMVAIVIVMVFFSFFIALLVAIWTVPLYCYIKADEENIEIFFFRWKIRQVPVSQIQVICSTGKDWYRNLCLSLLPVEELARRQEEILKKGVFTKTELPFRKRKARWQEQFAGEYLRRPKLLDCRFWKDSPVLWLYFVPTAVVYLKEQYPHIPYVNVLESTNEKYGYMDCDFMPNTFNLRVGIESDGIHIRKGMQERRFLPAESIKTVARVDAFTVRTRENIGHRIYLMVSTLSVEELAKRGKRVRNGSWRISLITGLPYEEELFATEYLEYKAWIECWNYKNKELVSMFYKPQNEQKLRQMYPHAQWLDISEHWKQ